jgi:hypothetical protein
MVGPDEEGDHFLEVAAVPRVDLEAGEGLPGDTLALDVVPAARDGHPAALVLPARRRGLSGVVIEGREEQDEGPRPVEADNECQGAGLVHGELGMGPDRMVAERVRLGVEDRVLDAERQGVELGEELLEGPDLEQFLQADRGLRRIQEDLEKLLVDALDAQPGEVDALGHGVDPRIDPEAEHRSEAGRPEDAERVVREGGRVGYADDAGADVLLAFERVDDGSVRQADGDAVRPEVAALKVLFDGEERIGGDDEVLVALDAGGSVPGRVRPGQGDVVGHAFQRELDDAEAPADEVHFSVRFEPADDVLEGVTGDEEVDLGRGTAQDQVPDVAADGVNVPPEQPDEKAFVPEIRCYPAHRHPFYQFLAAIGKARVPNHQAGNQGHSGGSRGRA